MSKSIFLNQYGTWRIERIVISTGYRWNLYLLHGGEYVHVANQGRRKTCLELADSGYRVAEVRAK